MKKLLFLAAAASLLASCASLSEPKLLAPLTKVTLVSVTANPTLYYVGDQPPQTSLADLAINGASNDGKNSNVANRLLEKTELLVAKAESALSDALSAAKGSTLVGKDALFGSSSYSGLKDGQMLAAQLKPVGYKFVSAQDAPLLGRIAKDVGANGVIVANFVFQKAMAFGMAGTGSLGAQTTLMLTAYDAAGKMVFTKGYVGVSKTTTGVVANVYDPTKYEPVLEESVQIAVDKFAADLAAR